MQLLKVAELKDHPKNTYYFEDMSGNKWNEFLESVRTSGIIEPIVVTEDKVIVSGHQRVRACRELGIEEIMAEVRCYDHDETKILKDLIETNIRQRGSLNDGDELLGRRWTFLKEVYGIKHGNNQHSNGEDMNRVHVLNTETDGNNVPILKSKEELAAEFGISSRSLDFAERLQYLPDPIRDAVREGQISASIAERTIYTLPPEIQTQIANHILESNGTKFTNAEIKEYIEQIKKLEIEVESQKKEVVAQKNIAKLEESSRNRTLIQKERETFEKYQQTLKQLSDMQNRYETAKKDAEYASELYKEAQARAEKADAERAESSKSQEIPSEMAQELEQYRQSLAHAESEIASLRAELESARQSAASAQVVYVESAEPMETNAPNSDRDKGGSYDGDTGFARYAVPGDREKTDQERANDLAERMRSAFSNVLGHLNGFRFYTDLYHLIQPRMAELIADDANAALSATKVFVADFMGAIDSARKNNGNAAS